ncbi:MAG: hypothetical protein B7Z72_07150, partial [Gemmatimonadetes bacterium 21-71-4]
CHLLERLEFALSGLEDAKRAVSSAECEARNARIGFDRVVGWASAAEVVADRRAAGLPVWTLQPAGLDEVRRRLDSERPPRLIDVRNAAERAGGVIPGSLGVSLGDLAGWGRGAPREQALVVQCHTGTRSVIGASVLRAAGCTDVTPMTGGYDAWTAAGLPVVPPSTR